MRTRLNLWLLLWAASMGASANGGSLHQEFPFQFRDGLIWVETRVGSKGEPHEFLLDSGASVSVLNLGLANQLGLSLDKRVNVQFVGANASGFWPQEVLVSAGGVALPKDHLVVDLTELSGPCHGKVDGLIGAEFFRGRIVQIDFEEQAVRVLSAPPQKSGLEIVPMRSTSRAFLVNATINRKPRQWLRLDTGCASNLQWVSGTTRVQTPTEWLAVGLAKTPVPMHRTSVRLGEMFFDDVPTGLHKKRIFAGEAGLLGNGLLARFRTITVDAQSNRLFLERFEPEPHD